MEQQMKIKRSVRKSIRKMWPCIAILAVNS